MNLIDTSVKPDPFSPQAGDVYESDAPPQSMVNTVTINGGASCKHNITINATPRRQRIVVYSKPARWSTTVFLSLTGEERRREVTSLPIFLASLVGCVAIGRVREAAPAPVAESAQPDSAEVA